LHSSGYVIFALCALKVGIKLTGDRKGGVKTELALNMPESFHSGKFLTGGRKFELIVVVLTTEPVLPGDVLVSLTSERREWLAGRYVSVNWDMPEFYSQKEEIVREDKLKMRMKF